MSRELETFLIELALIPCIIGLSVMFGSIAWVVVNG